MEDATAPYRPSGARLALISLLALVAILAFVVLIDVRFNEGVWWFAGLSDAASRQAMTILLLAFEGIAFAGVLTLLLIRPYRRPVDDFASEWTSTGGAMMGEGDTVIQIGCPGCGTVFEKVSTDVDEPHEQQFRCPNCGRSGRLRMEVRKPVTIRVATCVSCAREFQAYRATAECPHCHAAQT